MATFCGGYLTSGVGHGMYGRTKLGDFCKGCINKRVSWVGQAFPLTQYVWICGSLGMWEECKSRMQGMANVKRLCTENQFWP